MYDNPDKYIFILINYLNNGCKFVLFVIRPELEFHIRSSSFIREMKPYLHKEYDSSSWPGTELFNQSAHLLIYSYRKETFDVLVKFSDSFASWRQPHLPEDLCFLGEKFEVLLASSASERCVWIDDSHHILPDSLFLGEADVHLMKINWNLSSE
jgi:hypothetical protein